MTSAQILHRHNIHDTSAAGILRHIRREVTQAMTDLSEFEFKDARRHLSYASELGDVLADQLEVQ